VILIYRNRFYTLFRLFRLNVYMWSILLTYIRRRLSSRLCFPVFWEAGHDTDPWGDPRSVPVHAMKTR